MDQKIVFAVGNLGFTSITCMAVSICVVGCIACGACRGTLEFDSVLYNYYWVYIFEGNYERTRNNEHAALFHWSSNNSDFLI